jgi:hypothetical protein
MTERLDKVIIGEAIADGINWETKSHTNSSQLCIGVYPEGTTSAEVEALVRGTFGGRFNSFANGRFEYVAYTD